MCDHADARPTIHFTAESGWINDPLSPTWDGRQYHVFFQYVPGSTTWQPNCHWGHAVSSDLLHWRELAVALTPDAACEPPPGHTDELAGAAARGHDREAIGHHEDGAWSGSVVRRGRRRRIFYTSVDAADMARGQVRVADAASLASRSWTKREVVAVAPEGVTSFRDPFVWRDGKIWRMVVGVSLDGRRGTAGASDSRSATSARAEGDGGAEAGLAMFTSPDLDTWTPRGIAASRPVADSDPVWTGSLWECPQLVDVGGAQVLIASAWHNDELHDVFSASARLDGDQLELIHLRQLTHGRGYYAPAAFADEHGQPCIIFWMRGLLDCEAGRAGALSVPHRLVRLGGRVTTRVHPDIVAAAHAERGTSNSALIEPGRLAARALECRADGRTIVKVAHVDGAVKIAVDGVQQAIPADPVGVQIVLDGPCIEVLTSGGAFAHTRAQATRWDDYVVGASCRWI
jgi:beta-fructofuranosidase